MRWLVVNAAAGGDEYFFAARGRVVHRRRLHQRRHRRAEEDPLGHGVGCAGVGEGDLDVSLEVPDEVVAVVEGADRPHVQQGAGGGVGDGDGLGAGVVGVPVHHVQGDLVALAVGQVQVEAEAGGAVVAGGDAGRGAGGGLRR